MDSSNIKEKESGFTLVELMVTIAVAIILLSIVVPSFTFLIESNNERSTRDMLVSSIHSAKQQAQSKRVNVFICATADGSNCTANWGSDWLVYEDTDGDGALDTSNGDIIVSNISSKSDLIDSSTDQISFSPTGHSSLNIFRVCSNTDSSVVYQLELSRMGRVTYGVATGLCP